MLTLVGRSDNINKFSSPNKPKVKGIVWVPGQMSEKWNQHFTLRPCNKRVCSEHSSILKFEYRGSTSSFKQFSLNFRCSSTHIIPLAVFF